MASKADTTHVALSGPGSSYIRPELRGLTIIGVEEHTSYPELLNRIPDNDVTLHAKTIFPGISEYPLFDYTKIRLLDVDQKRITDMDQGGIAMQVLSFTGPYNTTVADPSTGIEVARAINDELKKAVDLHPKRFAAFAELPFQAPELAIDELHRCVKDLHFVGAMLSGSIANAEDWLDSPRYDSLLSAFEELDVPLFLHPGIPPKAIVDTYYKFPDQSMLTALLSGPGWGWHNDVAVHVLRLAVSGTLDRHPKLKIIIGHQGEMLPMMLQRFDSMFDAKTFGLRRSVGEALRSQVYIAFSGIFTIPATLIALQTWGVDRVLFANDYPFIDTQRVPEFLRALGDVVSPADMRKICETNAKRLLNMS